MLDAKARTPFKKLARRCIEITNSDEMIAAELKKKKELAKKEKARKEKARAAALELKKYNETADIAA